MSISYVVGEHYCILSIPKRRAQQYGIEDPNEVKIETTEQGISIKSKNAGVASANTGGIGSAATKKDDFHDH
jgi:hypothetical protein